MNPPKPEHQYTDPEDNFPPKVSVAPTRMSFAPKPESVQRELEKINEKNNENSQSNTLSRKSDIFATLTGRPAILKKKSNFANNQNEEEKK